MGLFIISCGSTIGDSTEKRSSNDLPPWVEVRPTKEDTFYGVSSALKQNDALKRSTATGRARDDIALQVNTKVDFMLRDFMQESGVGGNAQALEFTEAVSKQVASVSLSGSVPKEEYKAKDGTLFVLVEYPISSVRESALNEARKREALYNEFKAKQGFDALEKEIEKMNALPPK